MNMPQPFLNDRHISRSRASTKPTLPLPGSTPNSGVGMGRPDVEYSLVADPGVEVDVEDVDYDVCQERERPMKSMAPITSGRSSPLTAWRSVKPVPGHEKTLSMITLPSIANIRL